MELRRALLLFAIVLGVAAVVAALASPQSRERGEQPSPPASSEPRQGARPVARVRIDGRGTPTRRKLEIGRPATVIVVVDEPGEVELRGLGLTEAAEPRNPAVFDVLAFARQRNRVLFTPAGGVRPRALGELVSQPAK